MAKLSFDVEELTRINNEVKSSGTDISNLINVIVTRFDEQLSKNVSGGNVEPLIAQIIGRLNDTSSKIDDNFNKLTEFLKGQLNSYSNSYEAAKAMLQEAFNFIEKNFG